VLIHNPGRALRAYAEFEGVCCTRCLPRMRTNSDAGASSAIDVVGAAPECVELNQNWARDPKDRGLTTLCRSTSNFHASVRLGRLHQ
jgi:hypothetical protein